MSSAVMPWQYTGWLVSTYLSCYANDRRFAGALHDLYSKHRAAIAELQDVMYWSIWRELDFDPATASPGIQAYVADVEALAERYGLDRLGGVDPVTQAQGFEAIHKWCALRFRLPAFALEPRQFGIGVFCGGSLPSVEVPKPSPPSVSPWDAQVESLADYRARRRAEMDRAIDEELTNTANAYAGAGYIFPDRRPMLTAHLHWLYRRVAYREPVRCIAVAEETRGNPVSERTVRNETDKLARALNLIIPHARKSPI